MNFEGRPISADLSRPISVLAHNSTMLGQNHNMGCFSNSEFIAESESAFGIWKFQEFWNFSDALESLRKLAKLGLFGPFCKNKTLFPCKLKPQIRFWCQKVEICKIPAFWNLFWNHWNLPWIPWYWAILVKWGTFSTQIEAPDPILMSKFRNFQNSSDLEFILESTGI